ncbi:DNA ligase 3 [Wallemia ichthyophaga EXF-994]|uniref:DNA ligase 3 n=1 Tax=Wallemia ichthyophaga (strain EXF-994 / CBS 113033) TaxID=1299270 RepID=R9AGL2_WALI9|nr:DNA ligase 3 [Wallemia ichthyophaga EXF-994]EOR01307.1 DNA ligase 3 [Wallemia ichthyophaga EXF-994]
MPPADDFDEAIRLSLDSYNDEKREREDYERDLKRVKLDSQQMLRRGGAHAHDHDSVIDSSHDDAHTAHNLRITQPITFKASPYSFHPPFLSPPIRFDLWTDACVQCSSTRSRIEITNILTNYFRILIRSDVDSLLPSLWLFSHQLGPPYEPNELGIGGHVLNRSLKDVTSISPSKLRQLHHKLGDIGDVAFEATRNRISVIEPKPLTVDAVYSTFLSISQQKGPRSQETKTNLVKKLLVSAKGEQARYLFRSLVQNLRIGAVRTTLSTALARAFAMHYHVSIEESEMAEVVEATGKRARDGEHTRRVEEKLTGAEKVVRRVYARHPNYNTLVKALRESGLDGLEDSVPVSVGTPVQPMLGAITRSFDDVLTRLRHRPFTSEAKLDGQRCQLHARVLSASDTLSEEYVCKGWKSSPFDRIGEQCMVWIRLFSRRLEDMTEKYPDICLSVLEMFKTNPSITSFVVDAEIAAVDDTGRVRPFQELANRSRKAVQMDDVHVKVAVYAFDCMLYNGEPLLDKSFRERRQTLRTNLAPFTFGNCARWDHVPSTDDTHLDAITAFFHQCMSMKAEGIMVKLLDYYEEAEGDYGGDHDADEDTKKKSPSKQKALPATYEPDKRADSWLKVKKDYIAEIGDSMDLVPIGAWHGMGRKNKFWSPILLAVYDDDEGAFTAVCKCMSGFSDAFYDSLNRVYAEDGPNTSSTPFAGVQVGDLNPDIHFNPFQVWECRGADITQSPVYPAAKGMVGEKGLSIRFPRFIRCREDKHVEQANTASDLARMYQLQAE